MYKRQYLSRIENGDLIPSEEVISIIFNRLGLTFNDSKEFLEKGINRLKLFLKVFILMNLI